MLKQKILKFAKKTNIFSIDDLLIITEETEKNVINMLNELVNENHIESNDNNIYKIINKKPVTPYYSEKQNNKTVHVQSIKEMPGYEEFKDLPFVDKKRAYFLLKLLYLSRGLIGEKLNIFIEKWNKKNPDKKASAYTIIVARRKFKHLGLMGLTNNYRMQPSFFAQEWKKSKLKILNRFIELYLSDKNLSPKDCLNIIIEEDKNLRFYHSEKLLQKEKDIISYITSKYSKQEIEFYRLSKDKKILLHKDLNLKFSKAAEIYMHFIKKSVKIYTVMTYSVVIKNLLQEFKDTDIADINFEVIRKFKEKQLENYTKESVKSQITMLNRIIKYFYPDFCTFKTFKLYQKAPQEKEFNLSILSDIQIKELLKETQITYSDFYPILCILLSTGMQIGEVCALTWKDIDFENKLITVNKTTNNLSPNTSTKIKGRKIKLISSLENILIEWKKISVKYKNNFVFPNNEGNQKNYNSFIKNRLRHLEQKLKIEHLNFTILRDTYVSILIKNNFSLEQIKELLGYDSSNLIYQRYKSLLKEKNVDDIFKPYF